MSKTVFQKESLIRIRDEASPILEKQWREVSVFQDKMEYSPNWKGYEMMENSGVVHFYTARKDGELIGYFLAVIFPSFHEKSVIYSSNDALYVDEKYRGTTVAYRLIKYVEEELKVLGVTVSSLYSKVYMPFDNLCEKLGYTCIEKRHMKYIGE